MRFPAWLFLGLLALALTVRPSPVASTPSTPNIIVIMTDDQRWDTIGTEHALNPASGPPVMAVVTNELVKKGIRFTNAFTTTALCAPSRASFFTGQYAHTHGVQKNGSMFTADDLSNLLPTWLQGDSDPYRTGLFGKYFNNYRVPEDADPPHTVFLPPGWTTWRALKGQGDYGDPAAAPQSCPPGAPPSPAKPFSLCQGSRPFPPVPDDPDNPPMAVCGDELGYSLDRITDEAVDFIHRGPDDPPFFLYFAPKAPHGEGGEGEWRSVPTPAACDDHAFDGALWRSPEDSYNQPTENAPFWLTQVQLDVANVDNIHRESLETLQSVDRAVGRIVQKVVDEGLVSNTVIIYTSDNGYFLGEHKLEGKRAPYDEAIRIPLVIRPAGGLVPERTEDHPVLNIDLAPTILELANKTAGRCLEGRSLVPFLLAAPPPATFPWRDEFVIEHWGGGGVPVYAGMRLLNRKYVEYVYNAPNNTTVEPEFYNLSSANDPYETTNTYADNPVAAAKIAARLRSAYPGWPLTDPPSYVFSSTFECGSADLGKWTSHSPTGVTVDASAALGGTSFGLKVVVDATSQPANVEHHIEHEQPEARYHARFYFDPNDFYPGPGQPGAEPPKPGEVYLFFAAENGPRRLIAVTLQKPNDSYKLLVRARLEDDTWSDATFNNVANEPHIVEFEWQKASGPDADDGYLRVWMDPPNATNPANVSLTGLDNPANGVDFARLGAISVEPGASGTLYFDQFMSRRDLHIGPQ